MADGTETIVTSSAPARKKPGPKPKLKPAIERNPGGAGGPSHDPTPSADDIVADESAAIAAERAAGRDPAAESVLSPQEHLAELRRELTGTTGNGDGAGDDVSARLAATRAMSGDVSDQAIILDDDRRSNLRTFDLGAELKRASGVTLSTASQPAAMFDKDVPAGAMVTPGVPQRRTAATGPAGTADDLDALFASSRRRSSQIFEWARAVDTGFHLSFSRFYFEKHLLVDRFAGTDRETMHEVQNKRIALASYNAANPNARLGYLAYLVGNNPVREQIARAEEGDFVLCFPYTEVSYSSAVPTERREWDSSASTMIRDEQFRHPSSQLVDV